MTIKALAYLAINTPDLDGWEDFATEVLGLVPERSEDRIKLRLDDRSYRLDIRRADGDAAAWIGWEVASPQALQEVAEALSKAGTEFAVGTPEEVADREVCGLIRFHDPAGLAHEICWGASFASEPVRFSRPGTSYVTGKLGVGHVALGVPAFHAAIDFYSDVLGFRITDFMPDAFAFLRCNTRHHSVALMQWETGALHHLLLQAGDMEQVGKSLDAAQERGLVTKTLGRHAIDDLVSFYARTPSGWDMEIGTGGIQIDESEWVVRQVGRPFSSWGHRAVTAG